MEIDKERSRSSIGSSTRAALGWRRVVRGFVIGVVAGLVAGLSGCGGDGEEPAWKRVRMVTVDRVEGVALANLAKVIMEDKLGLSVEIVGADVQTAYQAVAEGDADVFPDSWQPVTDDAFMQEYGDELEDLGVVYAGARTGLVVPEYVPIDSVTQLGQYRERFAGRIIGVGENAGIMRITDSAISLYGLDYEVIPSSGPAAVAALREAMADSQWVVVTGWQPHWMFTRWNVKFLVDTLRLYGQTENIHAVASSDVRNEKAEVAEFFERFELDSVQMYSLMEMIADPEAESPEAEARAWMVLNMEAVNVWAGTEEEAPADTAADTAAAGRSQGITGGGGGELQGFIGEDAK